MLHKYCHSAYIGTNVSSNLATLIGYMSPCQYAHVISSLVNWYNHMPADDLIGYMLCFKINRLDLTSSKYVLEHRLNTRLLKLKKLSISVFLNIFGWSVLGFFSSTKYRKSHEQLLLIQQKRLHLNQTQTVNQCIIGSVVFDRATPS